MGDKAGKEVDKGKQTIYVRIDPADIELVQAAAAKEGLTKSDIVRRAVREWADRQKATARR